MNQKKNQGYQKTHENIKNCLNLIIQKKGLHEITIQELCLEAGINRSTFYAHYQDIYDVLAQIGEELNIKLLSSYESASEKHNLTEYDYIFLLLEHFKEYRYFYRCLMSDTANPVFIDDIKLLQMHIVEPILDHYQISGRIGLYYFNFMKAGFFAVIRQWLDENCPESTQKMAEILSNLRPYMSSDIKQLL